MPTGTSIRPLAGTAPQYAHTVHSTITALQLDYIDANAASSFSRDSGDALPDNLPSS